MFGKERGGVGINRTKKGKKEEREERTSYERLNEVSCNEKDFENS